MAAQYIMNLIHQQQRKILVFVFTGVSPVLNPTNNLFLQQQVLTVTA